MCEIKENVITKLQLLVDGKVDEYLNYQLLQDSDNSIGICAHLEALGHVDSYSLQGIFKTWEHYSGTENYPVPSLDETRPPVVYYQESNLYIGHQLEMRQSLAQHIIDNIDLLEVEEW